jgi:hypothetical protein
MTMPSASTPQPSIAPLSPELDRRPLHPGPLQPSRQGANGYLGLVSRCSVVSFHQVEIVTPMTHNLIIWNGRGPQRPCS